MCSLRSNNNQSGNDQQVGGQQQITFNYTASVVKLKWCQVALKSRKTERERVTCQVSRFYTLNLSDCLLLIHFGTEPARLVGSFSSLSLRDVEKLGSQMRKSAVIQQQSIKTEWKLAKIAFVVIIVFVLSWSPYACVTLIAWAG